MSNPSSIGLQGVADSDNVSEYQVAINNHRDSLTNLLPPIGSLNPYAGAADPNTNWLICDGRAISRTTYSALFAVAGTIYGSGNGSSTFNLPDMRGIFPLGVSGSYSRGARGGETTHVLTIGEIPSHSHTYLHTVWNAYTTAPGPGYNIPAEGENTQSTGTAGGGNGHNNMPPYMALNYIIRVL